MLNRIEWGNKKRGIITNGVAYQYVKEVCPDDSVLKIGFAWPLPDERIREFADQVEELYVVEEMRSLHRGLCPRRLGYRPIGKEIIPLLGELTPEIVDQAINRKKPANTIAAYSSKIPGRPPALCKGCPHGFVFEVLKKLDVVVNGDIGCYTLAVAPALLGDAYPGMHGREYQHAPWVREGTGARRWRATAWRSSAIPRSSIPGSRRSST